MTSKESKRLKPGTEVVFADGITGRVVSVGDAGVHMEWDDGQEGVIHHDDMQDVSVSSGFVTVALKPLALALLAVASLSLAACQPGSMSNMSEEDKALAVMLFAQPAYHPYQPVPFYPMQIPQSTSFNCYGCY